VRVIHLGAGAKKGDVTVVPDNEDASRGHVLVRDTDGETHTVDFTIARDALEVTMRLDSAVADDLTAIAAIGAQCAAAQYLDCFAATNGMNGIRRSPVVWSDLKGIAAPAL
jgi:hypothetical protein